MKRLTKLAAICAGLFILGAAFSQAAMAQRGPGGQPGSHFRGPGPGFSGHRAPGRFGGARYYGGPGFYFGFGYRAYPRYYGYYPYYYPYPYPYPAYYGPYPGAAYGQPVAPSQAAAEGGFSGDCQMIREYQAKVTIDGKTVDAYGDACLKADGSWEHGPAKLAPQAGASGQTAPVELVPQ